MLFAILATSKHPAVMGAVMPVLADVFIGVGTGMPLPGSSPAMCDCRCSFLLLLAAVRRHQFFSQVGKFQRFTLGGFLKVCSGGMTTVDVFVVQKRFA